MHLIKEHIQWTTIIHNQIDINVILLRWKPISITHNQKLTFNYVVIKFEFWEYKSSLSFFVVNFMFPQLQLVMFLFFIFSILNFGYFIRKIKQIHGKLWLMEHRVEYKKWYREFVFEVWGNFYYNKLPCGILYPYSVRLIG